MSEDERNTVVKLFSAELKVIHRDMTEMKAVLQRLTEAISHLAVVDERIAMVQDRQQYIEGKLEDISRRLSTLELIAPSTKKTNEWRDKISWLALGLVVMYALKHVGLIN